MTVYGEAGFNRAIHNIENSPFRTKFDKDIHEMRGNMGIGCISDYVLFRRYAKKTAHVFILSANF